MIAAGRKVFLKRGFDAASIDAIADEAGYTIGALYSSFATKAALFMAVFEAQVAERVQEIETAVTDAGDSGQQAQSAAEQLMDKLTAEPDWFTLFIEAWTQAARDPQLRERFAMSFGAIRLTLGRIIAESAERDGIRLPLPANDLAIAIKALGNGLALEKVIDPEGVPDDLFGAILTLILRGLEAGGDGTLASSALPKADPADG